MRPDFKIVADGDDITALLKDRLTSLSITDEAGMKSDTAAIEIDDRDYLVALPEAGAKLVISLGFVETGLVEMGTYIVDEISGTGPANKMTIKANAADLLGSIKSPKTRAWNDQNVENIVTKVAGEHGLKPAVSDALKSKAFKYTAQTDESDLNLLTRLAKDLDATAKPAGGYLVFVERGTSTTATGEKIPPVKLSVRDLSSWSWTVSGRGKYGSAIAQWSNIGTAKTETVTVGSGKPVLKMRHGFANADEAKRAATSALKRSKRASGKLSASLAGFYGDLLAEGSIDIQGIKSELVGSWAVNRVTHVLQSSLTTRLEAERDNDA